VNPDELAALWGRVDAADPPLEIQLCCPRGHFIVAVALTTLTSTKELLWVTPAKGRHHSPAAAGEEDFDDHPHVHLDNTGPHGSTVTLSCDRCPNWKPVFGYQRLAIELAVYALAGNREHRLPA
jgi:hypothetical protein